MTWAGSSVGATTSRRSLRTGNERDANNGPAQSEVVFIAAITVATQAQDAGAPELTEAESACPPAPSATAGSGNKPNNWALGSGWVLSSVAAFLGVSPLTVRVCS